MASSRPNPKSASALAFHERNFAAVGDRECRIGGVFEEVEEIAVKHRDHPTV